MSMILEALRRADRERQGPASTPPNLATIHYPPPPPGKRRHLWLIGGLLLWLAGTGLGVTLAYWHWSGGDTDTRQPPSSSAAKGLPEPAPQNNDPQEQPVPGTTPVPGDDSEPAPRPKPTDTERPVQVAQLYRSEPEPSAQAPAIHRLYNSPEPEPVPEPEPEPRPEPAVSQAAPEHTEPPAEPEQASGPPSSADNTLSIRALPASAQQAIPSIYYQDHHYRAGEDSYVVLNQREYRPGDQVVNDVILEQIAEDGIVLSFRGQRFRLARLSSWVNL